MKHLFKQTKVVYDAHTEKYDDVYYKNFLFWKFDRSYRVDCKYFKDEEAKKAAIAYANNILKTVEVYRS
jgi:hypothetical protein